MQRIEFYVQHLVRHNATEIELVSGEPVRFAFAGGDRKSNTPIDHAQITQLVQEAAPLPVMQELKRSGRASFNYSSTAGIGIQVRVEERAPGTWRVQLFPASTETAGDRAGAAPRAAVPGARSVQDFPRVPNIAEAPKPVEQERSGLAEDGAAGRLRTAKSSAPPPPPQVELTPGEPKINRYLRMMAKLGGSDLHLSSDVVPMVRLHGEMQPLETGAPLSEAALREILTEIMPERNRTEFKEKNDTDFAHMIAGLARFRGNVFTDRKGIGGVFRIIPFKILTPEQLGLPKQVLDLCWLSKGLVVVTGPTGSGKSTTLATLIDYINKNRSDHIITIEDPIEFVHDNQKCLVNQREIATHTSSFKSALRAALREDPDIVLVGEMRDLETIAIAIETAETGHLVFGTLHTTTAPSTVDRIIDQFPPDRQAQIRVMLSESLRGVIAQVLCKKKEGGRAAAYEILISTPAVTNLIREGKTFQLPSVMQTGRKLGMQTMNEHLLAHVKSGAVEPEEAYVKSTDKMALKEAMCAAGIQLKL